MIWKCIKDSQANSTDKRCLRWFLLLFPYRHLSSLLCRYLPLLPNDPFAGVFFPGTSIAVRDSGKTLLPVRFAENTQSNQKHPLHFFFYRPIVSGWVLSVSSLWCIVNVSKEWVLAVRNGYRTSCPLSILLIIVVTLLFSSWLIIHCSLHSGFSVGNMANQHFTMPSVL